MLSTPSPPQSWTVVAIAFAVFVLFQVGAFASWAFLAFDARYVCDRASDWCEVERVNPFRRESERFRPSLVAQVKYPEGMRSCIVVEMMNGAPEFRICTKAGEELAVRLRKFIADPAQARLEYVVRSNFLDYGVAILLWLLSLIPLYGVSTMTLKRLR